MADKVLIVDDDPSICKLLEKVMHSNDLETTVADSGQAALHLLKDHAYDIILMDVMLGDMEGFEVIRALRSQGIKTPVRPFHRSGRLHHQTLPPPGAGRQGQGANPTQQEPVL